MSTGGFAQPNGHPVRLRKTSLISTYSTLNARKMLGFVTLVWMLAFFIAVPQVAQTYAPWPDEFKDVICPLSAVSQPFWHFNCPHLGENALI